MSDDEKRGGARFLTDLNVELRPLKGGEAIDDRAIAHDVSAKGFKVETQAELAEKSVLAFTLQLPAGQTASGKGRVAWSRKETFATWAGIEITSMSWGDKRRLAHVVNPDAVDWENLTSVCLKVIMAVTVIIAAHRVFYNGQLRGLLSALAPKIIALFVMGWALVGMLKKENH